MTVLICRIKASKIDAQLLVSKKYICKPQFILESKYNSVCGICTQLSSSVLISPDDGHI